jgi:hypothetical protein
MKLSRTFSIVAIILISALLCLGGFAFVQEDNGLFFGALSGALLCSAFIYFGAFMQGLRQPPRLPYGRWRSLREDVEALAEVNPERPGLRKLYGWLLALIAFTIFARVIALLVAAL